MRKNSLLIHKLTHWEYWPEGLVFFIPLFYYFYLSMRARSFFFFNAANPSIKNGGMAMEPKHEIYDIQPAEITPKTLYARPGVDLFGLLQSAAAMGLKFPLIAKPDIGMKGLGVAKVNNASELERYIQRAKFDFLIQEMITFPNEVGVFYYRYPGEAKGKISGIVKKEFLTVTGDGLSSLMQLIEREPRYMLQMQALIQQYGDGLRRVLSNGEILNLVPFGNHARGAKFIDVSHLISQRLTDTFDDFCSRIPGFYYGRLDIRYHTFEELERGENFSIIELNGAGADPTHMFDPDHSIFFAWREIIRHWRVMAEISILNHRHGAPYLTFREGMEMFRQNKEQVGLLESFRA